MNKKKKKLVLFDIDGTLYDNKNREVPASTIKALEELHKTSIIGIATGRAEFMLYSIDSIIHLIDYFILINGQYIKAKNKVIYENPMDYKLMSKLFADMDKLDIAYGFEGSKDEAITQVNDKVIKSFDKLALNLPPINRDYYKHNNVYQAWAFCAIEQTILLEEMNPAFRFIRWMDEGFDILPASSSKGLGMKVLAKYLNVDLNDVIAFGDGDNDFEFIRDSGLGIAMGNASEKVKAIADYVTDTVDQDGLYKAVKHFKLT